MQKGEKILIWVFVLVVVLTFISSLGIEVTIYNPVDYARITDVDYKAVVVDDEINGGGKVLITERLTFDIHAASKDNLFWELWRDLPEDYVDGLKVDYKVNSVKQIYEDGSELVYQESPRLYWDDYDYVSSVYGPGKWYHSEGPYNEYTNDYECVFFYVDGLYREEVVFEIEYEMNNAALRYNDVSELYLTFYSEDTIKYLDSFKGEILISNKDMPRSGNYEAYTYGTNSHYFPFTESKTKNPGYHTFSIDLDEEDLKFKPYNQYLEFTLWSTGEDSHIFTDFAPENYYSNDDVLEELRYEKAEYDAIQSDALKLKKNTFILFMIGTGILIIYVIKREKKIKKKHNFYKPAMEIKYYRDIPSGLDPYFASTLVFCKHKAPKDEANGYSAIMLSLVRKGYIELNKINDQRDWTFNNIKITIKYKPLHLTQKPIGVLASKTLQPDHLSRPMLISQPQAINIMQQSNTFQQPSLKMHPTQTYQQPMVKPHAAEVMYGTHQTLNSVVNYHISNEQTSTNTYAGYKHLEVLTPTEEHYFNLIIRHAIGNEISMPSFQSRVSMDYNNTDSFVTNVDSSIVNIGISQGYFQKSNYQQPRNSLKSTAKTFMIVGIILVTLVNLISYQTYLDLAYGSFFILGFTFIISSIYLNKISKKYVLLTQYGEDEYAKWRGLYNFLNSETLMNERTVIELPLWEQYLVYATAFGISEKVIKALEIRCPDVHMNTSTMLRNPYYRSSGFRSSSRSFRSATRSASRTSRSGSYSGGGYYGGGGRGGGGGGGGH